VLQRQDGSGSRDPPPGEDRYRTRSSSCRTRRVRRSHDLGTHPIPMLNCPLGSFDLLTGHRYRFPCRTNAVVQAVPRMLSVRTRRGCLPALEQLARRSSLGLERSSVTTGAADTAISAPVVASLVRSRNRPVSHLAIRTRGLGQSAVLVALTPVNRLQTLAFRVRRGLRLGR
jgi:hypothetical protein